MKESLLALCIGYLIDLVVGDPHGIWHPVQGIGSSINLFEKFLRKVFPKTKKGERLAGVGLIFLVLLFTLGISYSLLTLGYHIHPYLGFGLECIMCYQLLATKSLKVESMKVYHELKKGDLSKARQAVSMIVGRDTDQLTQEGVAKAAVETVAENTSDGIIAPMIYMILFGVMGGFFYKAINTMDSMIGYKNDRYLYFGWAAARLDDVLNYIPARISAFLMMGASFVLRLNWKEAYGIYKRDRYNHASPNSAHTEAVCAGALGIALAGDAYYFGKLVKKKGIGNPLREIHYEDIKIANRLLYVSSLLGMVLLVSLKILIMKSFLSF